MHDGDLDVGRVLWDRLEELVLGQLEGHGAFLIVFDQALLDEINELLRPQRLVGEPANKRMLTYNSVCVKE